MIIKDDRTPEQRKTHAYLVVGTDSFLSGWGGAEGGASYAAWACEDKHVEKVEAWVRARDEMKRVRVVCEDEEKPYRPNPDICAHLHIYVVEADHVSLRGSQ